MAIALDRDFTTDSQAANLSHPRRTLRHQMKRIVSVYIGSVSGDERRRRRMTAYNMAYLRWFKVAEALARCGHSVDLAIPDEAFEWSATPAPTTVNQVPLSQIDWHRYDLVKTVFHHGFDTLIANGGGDHPCILSKLGSVVALEDRDGIYFHGEVRQRLYTTQQRIAATSRYITVLTEGGRRLWVECHGRAGDLMLVPGAVDRDIPPPLADPYPADSPQRCLFAGNIYDSTSQPEANRVLSDKLNRLGARLRERGFRVHFLGNGDTSHFDPDCITDLGTVPYERSWDYLYHADVGIVVSAGAFMHNNESSKIYHYLRAGLPVVSESGFPNDHVLRESNGGFLVHGENMTRMAECVVEAAARDWNRERMVGYVLDNHSWDQRTHVYARLLEGNADSDPVAPVSPDRAA